MKVSYFEGQYGSSISLVPETWEESNALARMTLNSKASPPELQMYFNEKGEPNCNVWLKSVANVARRTSITNKRK